MNEQNNQEEQLKKVSNGISRFITVLIIMAFKIFLISFIGVKALSLIHIKIQEVIIDKSRSYELLITNDSPFLFTCFMVMITILFFSTIGNMYSQQTNEQ